MSTDTIVVAGAGHAGFALAAALRQNGHEGPVRLVSDEPDLPYNRPPLSKAFLAAGAAEESLRFRPPAFLADNRVDFLAPERAVAIRRAERRLDLASGTSLSYDRLVLALGARNRPLAVSGVELPGVHYLRTIAEARAVRASLEGVREAVVIGAGFIGLEFAATAALAGIAVTVLDAAPRAMGRALSAEAAARLQAYHEGLGTRFLFGRQVAAVEARDGRAGAVRTAQGELLTAGLVLVGIGVLPNAELAAEAGLAVGDGVVVDEGFATSDPAIFALGDCASGPNGFGDRPLTRLESVQNANDSARLLAARLTDKPAAGPAPVPWFWSDQGKARLQIAGLCAPQDETVLVEGASGPLDFSVLRFREGRLACVESVNRAGDHLAARQLLARGAGPSPEQARAGGFDLKSFAKPAPQPARESA